jgi:hypothetical protein
MEIPQKYYDPKTFEPLLCPWCECDNLGEVVTDTIDYTPCEKDIICTNCERVVSAWAYGHYDIEAFINVDKGKKYD